MDHSAGSYVYDPAGRLRVYHRYGSGGTGPGRRRGHVAQRSEISCSAHWGPNNLRVVLGVPAAAPYSLIRP